MEKNNKKDTITKLLFTGWKMQHSISAPFGSLKVRKQVASAADQTRTVPSKDALAIKSLLADQSHARIIIKSLYNISVFKILVITHNRRSMSP